MAVTPATQLTLKKLRAEGFQAAVVEKYNHHIKRKQDLFGVIDVIGVKAGETIGVQTTSDSNVSSRVKKIGESDQVPAMRDANWTLHVHGWKKVKNRWQCRVVDVS